MSQGPSTAVPQVSAVVLAYGSEPHLEESVRALLASESVTLEVIVVDNQASAEAISAIEALPSVRVVLPGRNTGFAGGCNLGARDADAPILVFANSDAIVDRHCVAELVAALEDPDTGLVCASVRLADNPDVVNAVGNPVHFLYFSWAGGFGDPADSHSEPGPVASITGATFAARREFWDQLGGFDEKYFLYQEDVDLSMRTWLAGKQVRYHSHRHRAAQLRVRSHRREVLLHGTQPAHQSPDASRIGGRWCGSPPWPWASSWRSSRRRPRADGRSRSSRATAGWPSTATTSGRGGQQSRAGASDPTQTWPGCSPPT